MMNIRKNISQIDCPFIRRRLHVILLFFFLQTFPHSVFSQSFQLFLDLIETKDFPKVKIALRVNDNSVRVGNLTPANFTVKENGVDQSPFFLDCTEDSIRPPVSFMLLMDKSISMILDELDPNSIDPDSTKFRAAKRMFSDFVVNLRNLDEAALISFARQITVEMSFTSDTSRLLNAIYQTKIAGGTAIYDAIVEGVKQVSSRQNKKVIILLTDGNDNSSQNSITTAINAAQQAGISVYCIGLGADVNEPELRMIANQTGGEYFFAPTVKELAEIYNKISASIFRGICNLSYISKNPCPDGSLRTIEISFTMNNQTVTRSAVYTAPYNPASVTFTMDATLSTQSDRDILLPVYLAGTSIDSLDTVSFVTTYRYDQTLLSFISIVKTGSLLDTVTPVIKTGNGQVTIEANNIRLARSLPIGKRDVLFYLRFYARPQKKIYETSVELLNSSFNELCAAVTSGTSQKILIEGCPEKLLVTVDSNVVVNSGMDYLLPVRLRDAVDVKQTLRYYFTIRYDDTKLEFLGVSTDGTISEKNKPSVTKLQNDVLLIQSSNAFPTDTTGILFYLHFKVKETKESTIADFQIISGEMYQSCQPRVELQSSSLYINGRCQKLAGKRGAFSLGQNTPNPANPETAILFSIPLESDVRLDVFNAVGQIVGTPVNSRLEAGSYRAMFSTTSMPSGIYFYRLNSNGNSLMRKMIVMK